jgi:hypothetical protein
LEPNRTADRGKTNSSADSGKTKIEAEKMTTWEPEASQLAANGNTEQQTQINTEQNQETQKLRVEYKRDGSSVSGPKPIELGSKNTILTQICRARCHLRSTKKRSRAQAQTAEATKINRTSRSSETYLASRLAEKKLNRPNMNNT